MENNIITEETSENIKNNKLKNRIFYFSGTGNCYSTAKQLNKNNDYILEKVTFELIKNNKVFDCDKCIFIIPCYGYGMPKIFYKLLRNVKFNFNYCAVLTTYGTNYGACLSQPYRLIKKYSKKAPQYLNDIKTVENFIPLFTLPNQEILNKSINQAYAKTELIRDDINNNIEKTKHKIFYPFSIFVSGMFKFFLPLLAKMLSFKRKPTVKTKKGCTDCKICLNNCPVGAIYYDKNKKLKVKAFKCQLCTSCINRCPQHCVTFPGVSPTQSRYTHPDSINKLTNDKNN